jgi:diguanylate cyclase (GGDEF)-like protein
MLSRLARLLQGLSVAQATAVAVVLVGILAAADRWLGNEISLSVFFLAPVGLATWCGSLRAGLAISILSGVTMVVLDMPSELGLTARLAILWNGAAHLGFFSIISYLLHIQKRYFEAEKTLGRTDPLTGILNRRAFMEQSAYLLNLASRHGTPITVAYIDVDNLKQMNDSHGHAGGDALLKTVADAMQQCCRRTDLLARLGGDEFAIVLPDTNQEAARTIVAKFQRTIHRAIDSPSAVTCSVGVVTFVRIPDNIEQAVRIADALMYSVKAAGKNAVAFTVFDEPQ